MRQTTMVAHSCESQRNIFAETPRESNRMLEDLQREAPAHAGLVLRLPKCTRKELRRNDQTPRDITACCKALEAVCMKVLGAQVSPQADHSAEFRHVLRKAWAAYHSRRRIWATPGCFAPKMRIPPLSVITCASDWAAGTRHWTQRELGQLRTAQTRMTRRCEEFPACARRAAAFARSSVWSHARVARWDEAVTSSWWRWAGHVALLARWSLGRGSRASPIGEMCGG